MRLKAEAQAQAQDPSPCVLSLSEETARRGDLRRAVGRARSVGHLGGVDLQAPRSRRATNRCRSASRRTAAGRWPIAPPTALSAAEVIQQARQPARRPRRRDTLLARTRRGHADHGRARDRRRRQRRRRAVVTGLGSTWCFPCCTGRTARTARCRACSSWPTCRTSAPACWRRRPAWTRR